MVRRRTAYGTVAVAAIACSAGSLGAQRPLVFVPVRADQVMSAADQQRTGVASLTPAQREALDGWLTRYSAELRGAGDEPVAQSTRWHRGRPGLVPLSAPPGAPLVAAPEDGSFIRLADGTLWEVYLPDRTATAVWRRGDYIAVARAAAGVGDYDHVLVNAPAHTRAVVRFVGLISPRRR